MPEAPRAVGIIMDGNRRYARERGLATLEGHRAGLEKIREVTRWAGEAGVKELTLFAFSTENWNRAKEEVGYLMELFAFAFGAWMDELIAEGVRVRFIGQRERASGKLQELMKSAEERSAAGAGITLVIAFSYGGRAEILGAVNALLAEGKREASEEELRERMWSAGLLDPDLVIRTRGEERLSGFLTWQSVYSELVFTQTYWPAFSKEEFTNILQEYAARERRLGK
jgi:undecaprenyl diphosphate synthase